MIEITFGEEYTFPFVEVDINEKIGYPIFKNGISVGGIRLFESMIKEKNLSMVTIEGVEIKPEFRKQGIASHVIQSLVDRYDVVTGSTVEDESPNFWLKMGAIFKKAPFPPPMLMTKRMRDSIHTDNPLVFFITKNKEAKEYMLKVLKPLEDYEIKQ